MLLLYSAVQDSQKNKVLHLLKYETQIAIKRRIAAFDRFIGMFSLFTYRKNNVQEIEFQGNTLWDKCLEHTSNANGEDLAKCTIVEDDGFWKDYSKLIKQARKQQPSQRVSFATQAFVQDTSPLYSFSELGRFYAIGSGIFFSFAFLFVFLAMLGNSFQLEGKLYWLLLLLSLFVGVFFARSFKTCAVTSNTLIIKNSWMLMHQSFSLHQIKSVAINDNPNGYWFLQIETQQRRHKYSVNINYCKLRKLLDLLGENHIMTYDNISLSA